MLRLRGVSGALGVSAFATTSLAFASIDLLLHPESPAPLHVALPTSIHSLRPPLTSKCHGGAGWTLSDRFFTPSMATNTSLTGPAGTSAAFTQGTAWNRNPPSPFNWNYNQFHIQAQQANIPRQANQPAEVAGMLSTLRS